MLPNLLSAVTFQSSPLLALPFMQSGTSHGQTRLQPWQLHRSLCTRRERRYVARRVAVVNRPNCDRRDLVLDLKAGK